MNERENTLTGTIFFLLIVCASSLAMCQTLETITVPLELLEGAKPLEMILIPNGEFIIGSPEDEQGRYSNEEQHQVTLTKSFYLGRYEVTQAHWLAVMETNPSAFTESVNQPVENVSWNDCQDYIQQLNALGLGRFRLPTEAEWEYAARAGTTGRYYWGEDPDYTAIEQYAWYEATSENQTHEVRLKTPNAWGLYDISGNIWEWCEDPFDEYPQGPQIDPVGTTGTFRVFRGGSWNYPPVDCRCAVRNAGSPYPRHYDIGFRLVREYETAVEDWMVQ